MHSFIYDINELKKFYDKCIPDLEDFEVFFLSLSARNKYLTKEEQKELSLGRTEMFSRRIVRLKDFDRLTRVITQLECNEEGYKTKTNASIPNKCIVVYWNINPSNSLKAYRKFNKIINEYTFEAVNADKKEDISRRFNKMDIQLMNAYQTERGRRIYIDMDVDVMPEDGQAEVVSAMAQFFEEKNVDYNIIDTKGGVHFLVRAASLGVNKVNPNLAIEVGFEALSRFHDRDVTPEEFEIIINKNAMIPLPGTLQGGYEVRCMTLADYMAKEY